MNRIIIGIIAIKEPAKRKFHLTSYKPVSSESLLRMVAFQVN
jgi:hypothetical protein